MKTKLIRKHFEGTYFGKRETFKKMKAFFLSNEKSVFAGKMELGIADLGIYNGTSDIIIAIGFTGDYADEPNSNGIYLLLLHGYSRQIYQTILNDQCGALNDCLCDLLEQYVEIMKLEKRKFAVS